MTNKTERDRLGHYLHAWGFDFVKGSKKVGRCRMYSSLIIKLNNIICTVDLSKFKPNGTGLVGLNVGESNLSVHFGKNWQGKNIYVLDIVEELLDIAKKLTVKH